MAILIFFVPIGTFYFSAIHFSLTSNDSSEMIVRSESCKFALREKSPRDLRSCSRPPRFTFIPSATTFSLFVPSSLAHIHACLFPHLFQSKLSAHRQCDEAFEVDSFIKIDVIIAIEYLSSIQFAYLHANVKIKTHLVLEKRAKSANKQIFLPYWINNSFGKYKLS